MVERGERRLDRLGVLVEPLYPERQPAVPGFERRDPQRRVAVHDAAADERRHVAHAAPGMRRRTLQPEIVPGVEAARRIRRHHGKGVQDDGEVERRRLGPDRFEVGVVERHAGRRVDHDAPGPRGILRRAHLGERTRDIARSGEEDAAEAPRIGAAVIRHPAVIGAVHRHFEGDVITGAPGAEPTRRQSQVHIDAFEIHVGDPRRRVGIDPRRRVARALDPGKAGHVSGRSAIWLRIPKAAAVAPLTFGVGDTAVAVARLGVGHLAASALGAPALPVGEPLLFSAREIAFEDRRVGADMGVGIKDSGSALGHHSLRYFCAAACGR